MGEGRLLDVILTDSLGINIEENVYLAASVQSGHSFLIFPYGLLTGKWSLGPINNLFYICT